MATVGGSFITAHAILSEISSSDPQLHVLTTLGLVAWNCPNGNCRTKSSYQSQRNSKIQKRKPYYNNQRNSPWFQSLDQSAAHYQTNFVKDEIKGNIIPITQNYLWIRMVDVKSYVSVVLRDSNENVHPDRPVT